jgi:hypothetical protein
VVGLRNAVEGKCQPRRGLTDESETTLVRWTVYRIQLMLHVGYEDTPGESPDRQHSTTDARLPRLRFSEAASRP